MLAAVNGHAAVVKLLLQAGADTEAKRIQVPGRLHSGEGETALIAASKEGQTAIVELLLEAGANKEAKGKMRKTALDFANDNSHTGVVALLER